MLKEEATMLEQWKANTNPVLARDVKEGGTGQTFQFESVFLPGKEPNGTSFSAAEMNKIIGAVNQLSGQNLLINSDFRVHQRATSFSNLYNGGKGRYTADRWMVWCGSSDNAYLSVTCQDKGGLKIKNSSAASRSCTLKYFMEDADLFSIRGKRLGVAYSIDGTLSYQVSDIPASQTSHQVIALSIPVPRNKTITVDYVKAETVPDGTTVEQAKLLLSPYRPRPFAVEYAACIYYYRYLGEYTIHLQYFDGIGGTFAFNLESRMRIGPTPLYQGSISVLRESDSLPIEGAKPCVLTSSQPQRLRFRVDDLQNDGLIVIYGLELDAEIYE